MSISTGKRKLTMHRGIELRALIFATLLILIGVTLVYQAKTQRSESFSEIEKSLVDEEEVVLQIGDKTQKVKRREILDLNETRSADRLLPYLDFIENEGDRKFAAGKIYQELAKEGELPNVGRLGIIRATKSEIEGKQNLQIYREALNKAEKLSEERRLRREREKNDREKSWLGYLGQKFGDALERTRTTIKPSPPEELKVPILPQINLVKKSFIVRTPSEYFQKVVIWTIFLIAPFFGLHFYWQTRKIGTDGFILPIALTLSGISFIMMLSMRDPLRDSLSFADCAFGVAAGCLAIGLITSLNFWNYYYLLKSKFRHIDAAIKYVPLAIAVVLSIALVLFGTGPGTSDAKVNLGFFQPSEIIRISIILFIAAYLSSISERLSSLTEREWIPRSLSWLQIPRFKDVLPIIIAVAGILGLFFLLKDLGPALLMASVFMILFAVAQKKIALPVAGFAAIIIGLYINYKFRFSDTAADRVDIWLSPWDTIVRGGEQIVHSLWALASGGLTGTGLGLGDPNFIPAGHTDLVIAAIGEELGFIGIAFVFILYAILFHRSISIARNAASSYTFFLALGIGVTMALQTLLIAGGLLGLIPLTGIVTPFLSYGSTSMIVNFSALGILMAISATPAEDEKVFIENRTYTSQLELLFGGMAVICLGIALWTQTWKSNDTIIRNVLALQSDGARRYQTNPRIGEVLKLMPRGTIFDRNGLPLATSSWDELIEHKAEYEALGINIEDVCSKTDSRHYPFGTKLFYILGNAITRENFSATNTNFIEDSNELRLRGFDDHPNTEEIRTKKITQSKDEQTGELKLDPVNRLPVYEEIEESSLVIRRDYSELLPLLRNRYSRYMPSTWLLLSRDRSIKTSIHIGLQLKLTDLLRETLKSKGKTKGAIVVLDPQSGDLLASVSYPLPGDFVNARDSEQPAENQGSTEGDDEILDRARVGTYPPGSTFKLVTAMAALRKSDDAAARTFECVRFPNGRIGSVVRGGRVLDDIKDKFPHDVTDLQKGLVESCNPYFAHLGSDIVGADDLFATANLFEIILAAPNDSRELDKFLPQSSFGQGEVLVTPFQIAKVAASIANGGTMPYGRWITDDSNTRTAQPKEIIRDYQARKIADAMRASVTSERGTGYKLANVRPEIAGKTGTAEVESRKSHSWFAGFAPYNSANRIAFAVLVENGGYGGDVALPIAGKLVEIANAAGIIREREK